MKEKLIFISTIIVICILLVFTKDQAVGTADLASFWIAGHVFLEGSNPYDLENIRVFSGSLGLNGVGVQEVVHYPWDMPLFALFSQIPYKFLINSIFLLNVLGIAACYIWISFLYRKLTKQNSTTSRSYLPICAIILTVLFRPLYHTILWGQIGLFFILVFLCSFQLYQSKRFFGSGIVLALSTLKLHLFLFVYPLILFYVVKRKQWRLIFGAFLGFFILTSAAYFLNPNIYKFYFSRDIPLHFFDATLGAWVQSLAPQIEVMRFIPLLSALLLALFVFVYKINSLSPLLLFASAFLLSMITALHVYPYDFITLLPWVWILIFQIESSNPKQAINNHRKHLELIFCLFALQISTLLVPAEMNYLAYYPVILSLIVMISFFRNKLFQKIEIL